MAGRKAFEITPELLERVEAHATDGMTKQEIAASLGIHEATLYRKINGNREFCEAIKTGQAKGIAAVTNYLMKSAREGNVTAQIFYLKNRSPTNWNDRYHIEEKRRYVRKDVEITAKMTPQEAAQSYAETLRSGGDLSLISMKRRRKCPNNVSD